MIVNCRNCAWYKGTENKRQFTRHLARYRVLIRSLNISSRGKIYGAQPANVSGSPCSETSGEIARSRYTVTHIDRAAHLVTADYPRARRDLSTVPRRQLLRGRLLQASAAKRCRFGVYLYAAVILGHWIADFLPSFHRPGTTREEQERERNRNTRRRVHSPNLDEKNGSVITVSAG